MNGGFRLAWPTGLKRTPARLRWFERFSQLKAGLDLQQVSDALNEPYATVYRWADAFAYPFPDRRRRGRVSGQQWDTVDWTLRDAEIARQFGVSRERVRQVRSTRGVGPSGHRASVLRFDQFAKEHREILHGLPVAEIVAKYGNPISPQIARRIIRNADIRPYDPESRWQSVDWRLTNRDLAIIWATSPKYIANVRARLGVGASQWDARSSRSTQDPAFAAAVEAEKLKAAARNSTERSEPVSGEGPEAPKVEELTHAN